MKKVFFVLVMFLAVVFVNAQTATTPQTAPAGAKVAPHLPQRTILKEAEINPAIKDYLTKNFEGYKIQRAFKTDNKGKITYETYVKKDDKTVVVVFDNDYKFVKKQELHSPAKAATKAPAAAPAK